MKKLKDLRTSRNYSCDYMAKELGISKAYYWQIENNKRGLYYKTAIKIADIFNMRPDDLFYSEMKKDN